VGRHTQPRRPGRKRPRRPGDSPGTPRRGTTRLAPADLDLDLAAVVAALELDREADGVGHLDEDRLALALQVEAVPGRQLVGQRVEPPGGVLAAELRLRLVV